MERQKTTLIECLAYKGVAMCRLYQLSQLLVEEEPSAERGKPSLDEISGVWRNILKFTDLSDKVICKVHIPIFVCMIIILTFIFN